MNANRWQLYCIGQFGCYEAVVNSLENRGKRYSSVTIAILWVKSKIFKYKRL